MSSSSVSVSRSVSSKKTSKNARKGGRKHKKSRPIQTYFLFKRQNNGGFKMITDVKARAFGQAARKAVNRMKGNKTRKRNVWVMLKLGAEKGVKIGHYRVHAKEIHRAQKVELGGEPIRFRFKTMAKSIHTPYVQMGIHQHNDEQMIKDMNRLL